jgi:hypothetical protein
MSRTTTILAAGFAFLVGSAAANAAEEIWRTGGFQVPESVLHDGGNRLIVSNIVGEPMDANGTGYLSILSLDGEVVEERWAEGLDAPKGMAIAGDRLYVADITNIRVVDLGTGELVETLPAEGSVFLNDVAASDDGSVFVSDMLANIIYRVSDGSVEAWLQDEALMMPNGLWVDGGRLVVGTWGGNMQPDFTTEEPGGLISIDLQSQAIEPVAGAERFGNIDGVVKIGEDFFVTDFIAGVLYRVSEGSEPESYATLATGSADLGTDGRTLFVPMMMDGEVVAIGVE